MSAHRAATSGPSDYLRSLDEAWATHKARRGRNAPTVVSLFAGCGGSSLGYSMAGCRELAAVEWDPLACKTFKANFPGVKLIDGDIADIEGKDLCDGPLDILDASPPCQGFSTAGHRDFSDARNSLFNQFIRILRELSPHAFVMENVSGMVKGKMRLIFVESYKAAAEAGYNVMATRLNARYYGVPQSRDRLIMVGSKGPLPARWPAPSHEIPVRDAIGDLSLTEQNQAIGHEWVIERGRTKTHPKAEQALQGQRYAGQKIRDVWMQPASTLTTLGLMGKPYLRGYNCHPLATRTYSRREFARLSSFPDQFVFPNDWVALNQIGNTVPPLFMRAIAAHIREAILDGHR